MNEIEKRARELLAAEYERYGDPIGAAKARDQYPADGVTIRAIVAALTPPDGYVLVPVVPTEAMVESFNRRDELPYNPSGRSLYKARHCYAAMLAARPEVK